MKHTAAWLLFAAILLAVPGTVAAKDIDFRGMLRSYTGVRLSELDVAVQEQTVDISLKGWGDKTQITVNPYAYVGPDTDPEIGVREAYVDIFLDSADVRIGKQAIIWGKAEGAFITDIVSPQDMRSFILADFAEIRKGIPALRVDWYSGPYTLEGVWVPRFVPSSPPPQDSIWAQENTMSFGGLSPDDSTTFSTTPVGKGLEDSELFTKLSYFGADVNAEIMGGYAWDDLPTVSNVAVEPGPTIKAVDREYYRHLIVGGSLSTTVSSVVFRTEAAAYIDKAFTSVEQTMSGPDVTINRHHQLHALAGADWELFGISMSTQYILQYIHDYDDSLLADELSHTATFRLQETFLSERLTAGLFAYVGFNPADALLRPWVSYDIEDAVQLEAGAEVFLGDESGTFGRYSDNTMGYVSLRWYF
ncbi:MAG: DUF1302 family protein, partial [Spirochaetota bacterium]